MKKKVRRDLRMLRLSHLPYVSSYADVLLPRPLFSGAPDGKERLGEDEHAVDHLCQLHREGHTPTGTHQ